MKPFKMVEMDYLLQPGTKILWLGSNNHMYFATILIKTSVYSMIDVIDFENQRTTQIWIENIKYIQESQK